MAIRHLVPVQEYLHSSFEPDAEYVEGIIVPRAMPQKPHSKMERYLIRALDTQGRLLGFEVWPDQRIRTWREPARFRVPDLCLTRGEPDEDIFTSPPFLCIEILSPEDSAVELREKIEEYLGFSVEYVWIVDPQSMAGEVHTVAGIERVRDGVFRAGPISVALKDLLAS